MDGIHTPIMGTPKGIVKPLEELSVLQGGHYLINHVRFD